MTNAIWHILIFILLFGIGSADARQYKSKVFLDKSQDLGEASSQSVAELEAAFQAHTSDFQIAATGQTIARKLLANGEYEKAVQYYQAALATGVLADVAQRQLEIELAQLLLHLERYEHVILLIAENVQDIDSKLLLARAYIGQAQFNQSAALLESLLAQPKSLTEPQLKQIASLSYHSHAKLLAIDALSELRESKPNDLSIARQLTGLYIQLQRFDEALDLWALVYAQGMILQEQDILLLSELHQRQGAPEKAARIMSKYLEIGVIQNSAKHQYTLFELWYQAREVELAMQSLWQSIRLVPDLEKAMMLAQLQARQEQWQGLMATLDYACQEVLPDNLVGNANLLLGMAYHKLGQDGLARRAWLNATLIGGAREQARQWLAFVEAQPATWEETSRLQGICLPEDVAILLPDNTATELAKLDSKRGSSENNEASTTNAEPALTVITLPATRFYGTKINTTAAELGNDLKIRTFSLIKNLMKSGGQVNGKMHLLFDQLQSDGQLHFQVAFPYSGVPANRSRYRVLRLDESSAAVRKFQGSAQELAVQWQALVQDSIAAGKIPSGKARMVFLSDTAGTGELDVELQLLLE